MEPSSVPREPLAVAKVSGATSAGGHKQVVNRNLLAKDEGLFEKVNSRG